MAKEAGVDLFKQLTKEMIDSAAQMGTFLIDKRKVGYQIPKAFPSF